jgi:hypothetical protein
MTLSAAAEPERSAEDNAMPEKYSLHRRLEFSSDHREMRKVEIEFEDAPKSNALPNWLAKINAADLKAFCETITKQLEDLVG